MKYLARIAFLVIVASSLLFPQKAQQGLAITYGQFSLSYMARLQGDAAVLPFIEGRSLSGSKERFGIFLPTSQGTGALIEILDETGKTIKTISLNEFLGKTKSEGVKLLSNTISSGNRAAETIHEVALPTGTVKLITKALVTGDKDNGKTPEQLVITFSLVSDKTQNVSLRLLLPFEGSSDVKKNGAILTGKSSASAIALSVMPSAENIAVQKNILSIKSPVSNLSGETPVLWLVARGTNGASQSASKALAGDIIAASEKAKADPNIVVVNTVTNANAQPGDTVMYTLTCKNIGAGDATNVLLSNPVPNGTVYLEGSATGEGTDMSFDRETAGSSQSGAVTLVRWKLKDALKGGKEQIVTFKVIVQ
jgi:uncharacterized repeat protein (TIGR01451 family)